MTQGHTGVYKRRGGHVFDYCTLTETGTNHWAAEGYPQSDPSVTMRTETFKTERGARLAFMDMAKQFLRSR